MATGKKMIKIELASPEVIRSWSHGEVTKPETINYKSLKTEKGGLFDERIFGPTKNYECSCGKYKKVKNKGKICERCGVEITEAIVRRERVGHIELEEAVTHIWMLKVSPSRLAALLDLKTKEVEEVVYFVNHIVLDAGDSKHLKYKQVLDLGNSKNALKTRTKLIKTLEEIKENLDPEKFQYKKCEKLLAVLYSPNVPFSMDEAAEFISKHTNAKFGIGASAVETLLKDIDLDVEIQKSRDALKEVRIAADQQKLMKRLETLFSLKQSKSKPEWMVLRVIPVIPPDIRPIIQLDGGRFTTSEINDLYRRIIIRNERLKKVKEMGAPSIIINNEKRMLQEAVDALFDNERKPRSVTSKDKRPLKSLTSILKGKQGRFRQNLLGKRVDYSGRSVIAIGPDLKMYQAGIPRDMAIILFKPFVIRTLQQKGYAENVKVAEKMIQANDARIWEVLEEVIKERPVMLNRAPTLHRSGIQAFEPKIVKGKAIRIHPLVTTAFNADFDGDQMAVHLPISDEAIAEARYLMLGSKAILGPKDGKPLATPTQDIVLGNYFITSEEKSTKDNEVLGEGTLFSSFDELWMAYNNKNVSLHAIVAIPVSELKNREFDEEDQNKYLLTSVGKILFNDMFSQHAFPFIVNGASIKNKEEVKKQLISDNVDIKKYISEKYQIQEPIKKKDLSVIIEKYFKLYGSEKTAEILDNMKDIGFKYATLSGTTISAGDAIVFKEKFELFKEAEKTVQEITSYYEMGMLTRREKKRRVIEVWSRIKDQIQTQLESVLRKDKKNPIFVMADSGARGNVSNFTQLVGMRGLMNDPKGDIKELPIKSSFREGLTVSEFFISTHGARKGMADIALKTADSGYLTRRLVDVSQEIIITNEDCNPTKGFDVKDIVDTKNNSVIVPLFDRLVGRFSFETIKVKNKVIVDANRLITEEIAKEIVNAGITKAKIRSVLTCNSDRGVCKKCYGINLATGKVVQIGEPVGIIAAQSIGEPGTQLTMRTFHTGGVAGESDITQGLPRIKELFDVTNPKGTISTISHIDGKVTKIEEHDSTFSITVTSDNDEQVHKTKYGAILRVQEGMDVKAGQKLTEGAVLIKELLEYSTIRNVQNYILKEVQKVYRLQGIEISDKYIEIIIKQILNKVQIVDSGATELLPGEIISVSTYKKAIRDAIINNKKPPLARTRVFGIKKAPLESDSWLSSASFQDTARVITKAVIRGKVDRLEGLKENIMLGNLIPAGTGIKPIAELIKENEDSSNDDY
ncbi:DNA-directed RNA polymerase subunit beta' [Spiroplasma endosymbiont of Crioceris asparagi]|uniref:DNA-directed RNA polymerase subunit beta' n=1 Tax=Spiroplasma endosymbiont of Crioceris asparagi TaxID=3066286 RepID=UPI0030D17FB8